MTNPNLTVDQLKELSMFAQVHASNPHLLAWLNAQREKNVEWMVQANDEKLLRRAQGATEFIDKMIKLLASAHTHLR